MYESEFKKIIEASQNHSLTFFVGAGVSALSNVPTWKGMIDIICEKMSYEVKDSYSSDEYLRIPQMFYYSIKKDDKKYIVLYKNALIRLIVNQMKYIKNYWSLIQILLLRLISTIFWKKPRYNIAKVLKPSLVTAKCHA